MLRLGRCETELEVTTLMMMDSLSMGERDRRLIIESCRSAKEDKIVITHGTDTMVETAKLLDANIKDKTVVLTGAMIPYKFSSSDGLFNLGTAIAYAKALPPGVYIAMNGHCFRPDNCVKNRKIGKFEKIR
ncbi:MAG: asparaginase domain-containing protein [Candidatus Micrarchaeota archaeon]